jgi:23S rRNA A2030 N6-methylase RlmJ
VANRHFGKVADVWKHLALLEVLARERPVGYAETHAGSAVYPMVDDPERRFGIRHFLDTAPNFPALAHSRYRLRVAPFVDGGCYPGSSVLAMVELGSAVDYLLCDLDPVSTRDLRSWSSRLRIPACEVAEADGMTATLDWVRNQRGHLFAHIDPFDPHLRSDNGPSALECATQLAEQGVGVVYWYGFDGPDQTAWAYDRLAAAVPRRVWCGDVLVVDDTGAGRPGDLGVATSAGTGFGVVLVNVSEETERACQNLAEALGDAYSGVTLPDGTRGGIHVTVHRNRPDRTRAGR